MTSGQKVDPTPLGQGTGTQRRRACYAPQGERFELFACATLSHALRN